MSTPYIADPCFLTLGEGFADIVEAAKFSNLTLRYRNDRAAATVGLDGLSDDDWIQHFGHFKPLKDNLPQPLAQRYHGHQFRVYNPEIGDGRGFLFAQMRDDSGRLLDLGTKGSGTTPHSRSGDGRLTLKGGVREILATEMLEALGVNTSKSFSLIETHEELMRGDEPSPTRSSVLTRLSHGHIRIGTFQRLSFIQDNVRLEQLTNYVLTTYFGESSSADSKDNMLKLLDFVTSTTAQLAAETMASGFVHGVLNSDNINVTGESFDYGPWRFLPHFEPEFTAAYFDERGLYAYGRQPQAIQWDLYQLAGAFSALIPEKDLLDIVEQYPKRFEGAMHRALMQRLGVKPKSQAEDGAMLTHLHEFMSRTGAGYAQTFFDWFGGGASRDRAAKSPAQKHYASKAAEGFMNAITSYEVIDAQKLDHPYFKQNAPCTMLIEEVETLWAHIADSDDWQPLYSKIEAIRQMGEALGV